jgi:hypothetical protein
MNAIRNSTLLGRLALVLATAGGAISVVGPWHFDLSAVRGGTIKSDTNCFATTTSWGNHSCACESTPNCNSFPCPDPPLGCAFRCSAAPAMPGQYALDEFCMGPSTLSCSYPTTNCGIKLQSSNNPPCCLDASATWTSTKITCAKSYLCTNF